MQATSEIFNFLAATLKSDKGTGKINFKNIFYFI